jgi:vancomycin resistance protein YoaR
LGKKRLLAIIAAAVFGVLLLGYGTAFAFTGNKIPGDTSVLGIPLGGLSEDEAKAKLGAGLKGKLEQPVKLTAGGRTFSVDPGEAGLGVDIDETVKAAGAGRSLSPRRMWNVLTGGEPVQPVVKADEGKLDKAIEKLVGQVNRKPTEGSITFDDAKAVVHKPADGVSVEPEDAKDRVLAAYPYRGVPEPLPVKTTNPKVEGDALQKALKEYAEPAMSAPIRLTVGEKGVNLEPAELAPSLKLIVNGDGTYTPSLDRAKLEPLFKKRFKDLETLPEDAKIELQGGRPVVVPAKDGMVVARDKVVPTILALLPKPAGARKAAVGLAKTPAKFTTEAAEKLGVKEKISEFTTYFPHASYRNINIGRAAQLIDGTLLKPGEVFSLNKIVGERTAANGFTVGYIINNGVLEKDFGGGVSQSATTTFNAMFFAGLKDIQHKPHSFYIDRYPEGREATVAWPSVDLKFENDSDYGVLVDTSFSPSSPGGRGSITVRMWGTKTWTITAGKSPRYNHRAAGKTYNDKPGCEPHAPVAGFDVKVYRYFSRDGQQVKSETFTTRYNPADQVICGKKPDPNKPQVTTPPPR